MRILVRTHVGSGGGFARDGEGLIKALLSRGHVVDLLPTNVSPPLSKEVANLLTFPVTTGYDLEIHHVPPSLAECYTANHQRSRRVALWTMWEWWTVPESTPGYQNFNLIKNYSNVVAYTQQTLDAFRDSGFIDDGTVTEVCQGGFDPKPWMPVTEAIPELQEKFPHRKFNRGTYRFGMLGHLAMRKNPYQVIAAFQSLRTKYEIDAELILKTSYPIFPEALEIPGITVVNQSGWSDDQLKYFYWTLDSLINMSYGEGKDLPAMEATACGVPVILNAISGHQGWVHPGVQELVPVERKMIKDGYEGDLVDFTELENAMMWNYNHRAKAFDRAESLNTVIRRTSTWERRVELFGKSIGVDL